MPQHYKRLMAAFSRKKVFDDMNVSPLNRVLGIFDLTALGVGATLGVGVYVLAGEVALTSAGPAVVLSFFIAAIASVFAGICYAEFGSRVPRAGSAYIYSYVSVGEFVAFVIGWNLILEYCIGAASVVRGLSTYVDSLMGNVMQDWFYATMPMDVPFLSPYPDLFAFTVTIIFAVALAFGMRESSLVNNIFTVLNVSVVIFVIICGAFNANIENWRIDPDSIPEGVEGGKGGFFPYGFAGVVAGAAKCFYGFIGFDCIATAGEEAKKPHRTIPLSIVLSLSIIFLAYFGVSSVLTLMWPYYDQDPNAPLPYVFEQLGLYTAKWIVSIGAIFGLLASLFGSLYPLPRILYAMSSDGLLFAFMGRIHPRFKTPIWGTLLAGLVTATMACFFDLSQLVSMMSIGTLMAYSIVAVCVALLRYKELADEAPRIRTSKTKLSVDKDATTKSDDTVMVTNPESGVVTNPDSNVVTNPDRDVVTNPDRDVVTNADSDVITNPDTSHDIVANHNTETVVPPTKPNCKEVLGQLINRGKHKTTTPMSERIVMWALVIFCLLSVVELSILIWWMDAISRGEPGAIICLVIVSTVLVCCLGTIWLQPRSGAKLAFTVPFVPFVPCFSVFINFYLMLALDVATWYRFLIWMAIGFAIYFGYGIRKSKESPKYKARKAARGETNENFVDDIENVDKTKQL